jgi:hypothetical protein
LLLLHLHLPLPLHLHLLFFLSIPRLRRGTCFSLAQRAPTLPQSPTTSRSPTLHLTSKLALTLLLATLATSAQTPAAPPQTPAAPPASPATPDSTPANPNTPHGEVLFQSHGTPPPSPDELPDTTSPANSSGLHTRTPAVPAAAAPQNAAAPNPDTSPEVTDAVRAALAFTAYDLDARISPATAALTMRARITVRNSGAQPLTHIALQISSTLIWDAVTLFTPTSRQRLPLAQHLIDTDADHTGKASEAILTLPTPLAPGSSLTLDTLYSGTLAASSGRLERIGAVPAQAASADWDAIGAPTPMSSSSNADTDPQPLPTPGTLVALRGFGNVLWYPVAAPQLFLGAGNQLFAAIAQARLRDEPIPIHLRLAVEYRGDPPVAAYFCGRRQTLTAIPDDPDAPTATGSGIATADFATEPLGFRLPSLFVIDHPEAILPVSAATPLLAVETSDDKTLPLLSQSATSIEPLLDRWFGARPLSELTILDHSGQPFEDGPLLVAPAAALAGSTAAPALTHSLTHAWVQTGQPWMDEGLAQFMSILWVEQQRGREAALAELESLLQPLPLVEPDLSSEAPINAPPPISVASATSSSSAEHDTSSPNTKDPGEPLIAASNEVYYRRKAAAVWWMLRDLTGDDALRQALSAWRTQPISTASAEDQAVAFETLLEKTSGKDLGWFFSDWVLRDRGLPDLTLVDVTPRQLPATKGHDAGWLVAVTIRNDGAATADVPLVIRSGTFSVTKRERIPGFTSISDRIIVETEPTQVLVNDGSVPEVRTSHHTRELVARSQ